MSSNSKEITGSLEDYLETIYRILGWSSVARVRDIAEEMQVSPASVSPAMKRLSEKKLIRYSPESIDAYLQSKEQGTKKAKKIN